MFVEIWESFCRSIGAINTKNERNYAFKQFPVTDRKVRLCCIQLM